MTRPLSDILARPTVRPRLAVPDFTRLDRTVSRILERYDPPVGQRERDPEQLLAQMAARIEQDDWRKVPMSFVTRVARVAFSDPWRDRAEHAAVRRFLLAEVAASDRAGFLDPMVRIYIEHFEPSSPGIRALGRALDGAKARLGPQWIELLERVPQLFDSAAAPKAVAGRMGEMEDVWMGLRAIGLRHPHAPGLMDHAHLAFLKQIAPNLKQGHEIERLLNWLQPSGQPARGTGASEAIDALLRPWRDAEPPADIKRILVKRLPDLYGHPKVSRNAVWNLVDPVHERRLLHWLTGEDIRFLFRILTEVERHHMWADREEFWWTLYEQGRIQEVWIAFNADGYRAARIQLPSDARQSGLRFARQVGESDKSLLLMRFGDKIVVEGTYNFKVHVFDADDPASPRLYQRSYDVANIRGRRKARTTVHHGDWQRKVLMQI